METQKSHQQIINIRREATELGLMESAVRISLSVGAGSFHAISSLLTSLSEDVATMNQFKNMLSSYGFSLPSSTNSATWMNVSNIETSNTTEPAHNRLVRDVIEGALQETCGDPIVCSVLTKPNNGTHLKMDIESSDELTKTLQKVEDWRKNPDLLRDLIAEKTGLQLNPGEIIGDTDSDGNLTSVDLNEEALRQFEQEISWSPRLARAK